MIKLDLATSSDEELETIITERCSQFGSVSQVVIMRDKNHPFALALVVMADRSAPLAVLRNLGDTMLKHAVVIRLEQR
jgi:hypothetical protein